MVFAAAATHHDVAISNLYGCPQVNTIAICLPFYLSIVYQSQRIAFALACCYCLRCVGLGRHGCGSAVRPSLPPFFRPRTDDVNHT